MRKLCVVLILSILEVATPSPTSDAYSNSAILDNDSRVQLFWRLEPETESIVFEVQAATRGWVGIGLSPNGGMAGADIVIGYVDADGKAHLHDYHADANARPMLDRNQDYELISGTGFNGQLVFTFRRKLDTCDDNDWLITDDTVRVIWALGEEIPASPTGAQKHAARNRGTRSVYFLDQPQEDTPAIKADRDIRSMDFRATNAVVPDDYHTLYYCLIFELPQMSQKHHLIKYEPVIQPGNEAYVHHMVLYTCNKNMSEFVGKGEACFDRSETEFTPMYECRVKILAAWAVGGEPHIFPDHVGFPVFEEGSDKYLLLEMHYDNSPYAKNIRDSSGLRMYITPNLRPIDSGMWGFGIPPNQASQIIPPGQSEFTEYSYCTSKCTKSLPKDGVNVFAGLLHTHLVGRSIVLHHIRDGEELPPLLVDMHYDFNYQNLRMKRHFTKVFPGDEFILECTYDTRMRRNTTFGGFSTQNEMCLAFVEFYPASKAMFGCMSMPIPKNSLQVLGLDPDRLNDGKIATDSGTNITIKQWVQENVHWDANSARDRWGMVRKFQDFIRNGENYVFCGGDEEEEKEMEEQEAKDEGIQGAEEPTMEKDKKNKKPKYNEHFFEQKGSLVINKPYKRPTKCAWGARHGVPDGNRENSRADDRQFNKWQREENRQAMSAASQMGAAAVLGALGAGVLGYLNYLW